MGLMALQLLHTGTVFSFNNKFTQVISFLSCHVTTRTQLTHQDTIKFKYITIRLRGYERSPTPLASRLENALRAFYSGVLALLKSKSHGTGLLEIELVCLRYMAEVKGRPSDHRGYYLYQRKE